MVTLSIKTTHLKQRKITWVIKEGKLVSPTTIIILKVKEAIKIKILGGSSNKQGPFQQQQPLYPSVTERLNKFGDTLENFMKATMASQKNNIDAIRNIENQVAQIAKQLAEGQSGLFSANTKTNPREHCNKITSKSGRIVGEKDGNNALAKKEKKNETKRERDEKEREKKRSEEEKN